VEGSNLHNCFQFTEAPCANEEKYVSGPLGGTIKRRDSSAGANIFLGRLLFRSLFL